MAEDLTLTIAELFFSIQGESSYAGYPCIFIRLADCNLRCSYCDARYTYEENHPPCSLDVLYTFTDRYPDALIEITGGEPLLQENVYPFMEKLIKEGRKILLETNGSIDVSKVLPEVVKIMDIKCPDSGMHEMIDLKNLARLGPSDELKFVISSQSDYEWARSFLEENSLLLKTDGRLAENDRSKILFSPVQERIKPARLAEWILADKLPVRFQLQLHKVLWPEKSRGV